MKTLTINLYSFNELNNDAKQRAKDNYQYDDFGAENRYKSMQAAKELYKKFNINAEIKGARLYKFIQNNILPELRKHLLYTVDEGGKKNKYFDSRKSGQNEVSRFSKIQFSEEKFNLTGYGYDSNFLEPIFDFLKHPYEDITNFDLYETPLQRIFHQITEREHKYFFEDENFAEHCESNGFTFEENGKMRNF